MVEETSTLIVDRRPVLAFTMHAYLKYLLKCGTAEAQITGYFNNLWQHDHGFTHWIRFLWLMNAYEAWEYECTKKKLFCSFEYSFASNIQKLYRNEYSHSSSHSPRGKVKSKTGLFYLKSQWYFELIKNSSSDCHLVATLGASSAGMKEEWRRPSTNA